MYLLPENAEPFLKALPKQNTNKLRSQDNQSTKNWQMEKIILIIKLVQDLLYDVLNEKFVISLIETDNTDNNDKECLISM